MLTCSLSLIFFKIVWWINRRLCRRYMFCIPISHHSNWFVIFNRRSYMNIYLSNFPCWAASNHQHKLCPVCLHVSRLYVCELGQAMHCVYKIFCWLFPYTKSQSVCDERSHTLFSQHVHVRVLHMSATKQIFTRIENRATKSMHSLL